jgi:O-methyltransferase
MKLTTLINRAANQFGFGIHRHPQAEPVPGDLPSALQDAVRRSREFTLSSHHRLAATVDAVRHVVDSKITGDIVECGVWRGGNMVVAALALLELKDTTREIYLYDTFEGMTPPSEHDKDYSGEDAAKLLNLEAKGTGIWCEAGLEDVTANMKATGYPMSKVRLVKGPVEETIPRVMPDKISLLRLDTDWYESTKHELVHLFPRLVPGGVLIIDDYGHWQGARQAVDEYFAEMGLKPLLSRIDYTCRLMVKDA